MDRRIRIRDLANKDRAKWQALYYRHQKLWQQQRLLALKTLWDGQSITGGMLHQGVQRKILETWLVQAVIEQKGGGVSL